MEGLDNTSTTGEEAFETIASIVENLGRHGAGETWSRATLRSLSAGKKERMRRASHLGPDELCADHCTVFALWDPVEEKLEEYVEHLDDVAEQEIGLKHPLVYEGFNFCELSAKVRLAKVLQKQKLSQLQPLCEFFDVETIGSANRKVSYYEHLLQLANFCDCRK